jgi:Arc/MetJ-type ribon-helix-helix transcriptional regulator
MNVSLPESLVKDVERDVKKKKFASKSAYIRQLLRDHFLALEIAEMDKKFDAGKGKILNSFADLD